MVLHGGLATLARSSTVERVEKSLVQSIVITLMGDQCDKKCFLKPFHAPEGMLSRSRCSRFLCLVVVVRSSKNDLKSLRICKQRIGIQVQEEVETFEKASQFYKYT